eukprot:scaffold80182_cov17-Tisochrysis_lutea.AAC.2
MDHFQHVQLFRDVQLRQLRKALTDEAQRWPALTEKLTCQLLHVPDHAVKQLKVPVCCCNKCKKQSEWTLLQTSQHQVHNLAMSRSS